MAPQQFSPKNKRLVMIAAVIVVFVILLAILLPRSKPAPATPSQQPVQQQQAAAPAATQKAPEKTPAKAPVKKAPKKTAVAAPEKAPQKTVKPPKKMTQKQIGVERKNVLSIKDPVEKLAAIDEFVRKHRDDQTPAVYQWVTDMLQTRVKLVKERKEKLRAYDQILARYPDHSALDDWSALQVAATAIAKAGLVKNGPEKIALLDQAINIVRDSEEGQRRALFAQSLNRKAAAVSDTREKAALYDSVFAIPFDEGNRGLIREYAHAILKRAELSPAQEKQQLLVTLIKRFDSIDNDPLVEYCVMDAKMQLTADMPDETALRAYNHLVERYGDSKFKSIQKKMKVVDLKIKELQDKTAGVNG